MKSGHNPIELWKAIHGGCWPGPPPDLRLTQQVNEVMSGLALFNLATGFSNAQVARQARTLAVASLNMSLAALQKTVNSEAALKTPASGARLSTRAVEKPHWPETSCTLEFIACDAVGRRRDAVTSLRRSVCRKGCLAPASTANGALNSDSART
ncbi:MAG: hypothetical protein IPK15_22835 [Verrucomicrobia bacterium]|nr:hypothetical protein [Verrucomicrobiota bacterium]